jgi:hypothetical protein
MSEFFFPLAFRGLIVNALPTDASLYGDVPANKDIYLPGTHAKALNPNNMLVEGIRGSGKSFWWAALQDPNQLEIIGQQVGLSKKTIVSVGFGDRPEPDSYPGRDALTALLEKDFDARRIWQTIVFQQIATTQAPAAFKKIKDWSGRIQWVEKNPEAVEKILFDIDNSLDVEKTFRLVLFDALDRTSDQWPNLNKLVRGLLQVVLDFRPYKRLRLKVFARPDQLADPSVKTFPDSSKILTQKISLDWSRRDLYGLLWQYLANDVRTGKIFREGCVTINNANKWIKKNGVWLVPDDLRSNEEEQKSVFHAITGPWMGKDKRRGFPYSWLPSHLADTLNKVSPRSFLAAIRHAALDDNIRSGQDYALHYESIKRGVQEASAIRVSELEEDYPWINTLFKPLDGLSVPCQFKDIEKIWKEQKILANLSKNITTSNVRLPPIHLKDGPKGVLRDIIALGLAEQIKDGRINLPDVYRVGYRMGRRGGVKPIS